MIHFARRYNFTNFAKVVTPMTNLCPCSRCRTIVMTVLVVGLLTFPAPAYAYLDPGTGSTMIQIIVASVAMAAGCFRLYFYKVRDWLATIRGRKHVPDPNKAHSQPHRTNAHKPPIES